MFCTLCEKHCKVGPWVNGTHNFRLKTLETHLTSNEHKAGLAADAPGQQVLPAMLTSAQHRRNGSIIAALRTVYWIVTEEITNRNAQVHFSCKGFRVASMSFASVEMLAMIAQTFSIRYW